MKAFFQKIFSVFLAIFMFFSGLFGGNNGSGGGSGTERINGTGCYLPDRQHLGKTWRRR